MQRDHSNNRRLIRGTILILAAAGIGAGPIAGCRAHQHPDDKSAVYQKLNQNELASVEVFQDRHSGVITLKGVVGSQADRQKAESMAAQAAPGYTIQNHLSVNNTGIMSMAKPNASAPQVRTEPAR
jgi:hypothetical protein